MRVFVCETVTGGGLAGKPLPASLAAEGALMRDALIGDLEDLPGVGVVTTHDERLPAPPRGESRPLGPDDDAPALWAELAASCGRAWPIAPETAGELAALAGRLAAAGARVIGPDMAALLLCASKRATAEALAAAKIACVPTYLPDAVPPDLPGPYVLKPDDGAGCLDTLVCDARPARPGAGCVVQPLIHGEAASLVVLCRNERAYVLAASSQLMSCEEGRFAFHGVVVGNRPTTPALCRLASRIHEAIPGLNGIVGIDYLDTATGPVVLEINPRLTVSYAGLRPALGINPVAFIADLIRDGPIPDLPHLPSPRPIEVRPPVPR